MLTKHKVLFLFLRCVVLFAPLTAIPTHALGQSYSKLVFDGKQSETFGSYNLITAHHVLYGFEDRYLPDTLLRRNTFLKRSVNFSYRLVKLFFLDAQLDGLIALTQHEVFGHGARFREYGFKKNSFNLNLYPPFGDGSGFAQRGTLQAGLKWPTYQENIAVNTSGVQAEMLLANDLTAEMLLNDTLQYRQGLLFLISQNSEMLYLWMTRLQSPSKIKPGNDMANYISSVNYFYGRGINNLYDIKALSEQSLISTANPMQAYAIYSIVYSYLIKGQKGMYRIPMIPLGKKLRYLPAFNFSLTPFGSQFHFVNYFRYKKMLLSCDIHVGDNRYKDFYGITAKGYNLIDKRWITLNVQADFWNQPRLELEDYALPSSVNLPGGAIKASVMLRPIKLPHKLGLFIEAGYKTKGYMDGEYLAETLLLRYGLSLHL
ncbi:MAG: hypothetical protein WCL06_00340 [Bacteroidota bacterium]